MLLNLSLFIVWTVIMGIYVLAFYRDMTVALVAFCLGVVGYAFIFILALACLKLWTLTDKNNLPIGLRVSIYIIKYLGVVFIFIPDSRSSRNSSYNSFRLISMGQYTHWNINLPTFSAEFADQENVRIIFYNSLSIVSIMFSVVMLGYAIFAIIYYHNSSNIVLQALSVILIVLFLCFGGIFIYSVSIKFC